MKAIRSTAAMLLVLGMFILLSPQASANDVSITVDGQSVQLDQSPVVIGGRVMLPMRTLFEMFNLDVHWNPENNTIISYMGNTVLRIQIGSERFYTAMSDDNARLGQWWQSSNTLDSPPIIIGGRTYVPLRFIGEQLNYNITWDAGTRNVSIDRRFFFRDGAWYGNWFGSGNEVIQRQVELSSGGVRSFGQLHFLQSTIPDGPSLLYMLDSSSGTSTLIGSFRPAIDVANLYLHDGFLYIVSPGFPWSLPTSLFKINMVNPFYRQRLGDENFSYGLYLASPLEGDSFIMLLTEARSGFRITDDGIVVVGFDARNLVEAGLAGADRYANFELLRESYGHYLLPFDGGAKQFLERLPLELGT